MGSGRCQGPEICSQQQWLSMQVDKKFVPLVCGSQLAIMDQHAADERVQLERLTAQVRHLASLVTVQFQVLSAFSKLLATSRRAPS